MTDSSEIRKEEYVGNEILDSVIEILMSELNLLDRAGVERSNITTLSIMTEIFETYNIDEEYFAKSIKNNSYSWIQSEFFEESRL